MYRQAFRSAPRAANALRQPLLRSSGRRFASTSPADKPRTWKSSALRWGLAGAAVYYYSTSAMFADEVTPSPTVPAPPQFAESDLKTVDAVIEEKRQKATTTRTAEPQPAAPSSPVQEDKTAAVVEGAGLEPGSPEALEEEAGQQGAFNPETGEINWDCPCLGGMADGPCGEEFKTAFSCFVYSTEEPKGIDCIEKFQGMQECFKKYPEVYAAELADDEDDEAVGAPAPSSEGDAAAPAPVSARVSGGDDKETPETTSKTDATTDSPAPLPTPAESSEKTVASVTGENSKAFDATDANDKV